MTCNVEGQMTYHIKYRTWRWRLFLSNFSPTCTTVIVQEYLARPHNGRVHSENSTVNVRKPRSGQLYIHPHPNPWKQRLVAWTNRTNPGTRKSAFHLPFICLSLDVIGLFLLTIKTLTSYYFREYVDLIYFVDFSGECQSKFTCLIGAWNSVANIFRYTKTKLTL